MREKEQESRERCREVGVEAWLRSGLEVANRGSASGLFALAGAAASQQGSQAGRFIEGSSMLKF